MDENTQYSQQRWAKLGEQNALWTRPYLDVTLESAHAWLTERGIPTDLQGKHVLCVASGGGQQSAIFAVAGAIVSVVDASESQLAKDRLVSAHYKLPIRTVQTDMRDLAMFDAQEFDIVLHPYSINFVPVVEPVFDAVSRVIKPNGLYWLMMGNPFTHGTTEHDWHPEKGYLISRPYIDGEKIYRSDPTWAYTQGAEKVPASQEYRHTLSKVINALLQRGFNLERFSDNYAMHPEPEAKPGSWDHFVSYIVPWWVFWWRKSA